MSYCSNCGAELEDKAKFCYQCGEPTVSASKAILKKTHVSSIAQQSNTRMESISELNRMEKYFSIKQAEYDEYDYYVNRIGILKRGTSKAPLVWGIILILFTLIQFVPGIIVSILARGFDEFNFWDLFGNDNVKPYLFIFAFLLPIALGIFLIVLYNWKSKRCKKELDICYDKEYELALELTEHYKNYGYCLIGAEYTNPKILALIADVFRAGRADTLKEAINILLDDAHKTAVEFQNQLTYQAVKRAEKGATAAAVFSAASFFLR